MAELIIYADVNFGGLHTHIFESVSDLRQLSTTGANIVTGRVNIASWNDQISSFVVQSGEWRFFRDINFQNPIGTGFNSSTPGAFGIGLYSTVAGFGIPNDAISSIQVVLL